MAKSLSVNSGRKISVGDNKNSFSIIIKYINTPQILCQL